MFVNKLRSEDWMVIFSILFLFGAHLTTQFVAGKYEDIIGDAEKAQASMKLLEANPFVAFFVLFNSVGKIIALIMIPALLGSIYWYARRTIPDRNILSSLAVLFFLATLMDVSNDLAYAGGLLLRAGVIG